jgi:hypothetical protein
VTGLLGLVMLAWFRSTIQAQVASEDAGPGARAGSGFAPGFGGGFGSEKTERPEKPVASVFISQPVTERAAKTWIKLQEPIKMAFTNETPLEDVLKYIKEATRGKADRGMAIYVDPIGLQEAEKTMTSPVTLDLEDVPLATSLTLLLKQLGLTYSVQKDGLLVITSGSADNVALDPSLRMLDEIRALRLELETLRREVSIVARRSLDNPSH